MMLSGNMALKLALCAMLPMAAAQKTLSVDGIAKMGNNSLFLRWRPVAHFQAPAGWMNDPCSAMYDPHRDMYHLFYQSHPQHVNWGNISWGHAVSKDLIYWEDVGGWRDRQPIALGTGPKGSYNHLGIFSGTGQPVNLKGKSDGTLSLWYTSVSKLPIGWTLPYQKGAETWSVATSSDGGVTWKDYGGNPILGGPPKDWNITGWRDPFVEPVPELDELLGNSEPHYYAVLGSGIKGAGPRIPLYSAPASDLTKWTFLGALWEPKANTSLGTVLETGTYAFNFEVSGFFPLKDSQGKVHWYVNMGTEGGNVSFHQSNHWALWNEGTVTKRANGSAQFTPVAGGAGDWGNAYALTSFADTKNGGRRIQWAWIPEDLGNYALLQQGYQGAFALPRQLFVHEKHGIVDPPTGKGNARYKRHADGTYTAYTLGVRPLPEVVRAIRRPSTYVTNNGGWHSYKPHKRYGWKHHPGHGSYHMSLTVTISQVCGQKVGVYVAASPDREESTAIYYSPGNNTIQVDRSKSSKLNPNNTFDAVVGYFKPYELAHGDEDITMTVFLDGSMLEVYVNNRFALTTRIYPARSDSTGFGTYLGKGSSAKFSNAKAWVGLQDVWPKRPTNSSSPLLYDTAAETDNYTWWQGYRR